MTLKTLRYVRRPDMASNTLFLRLEGPIQAWGCHTSKFSIRRSLEFPSKSGVIGLLCAALGVSRESASDLWLPKISEMIMGVRIDRPGFRWWDYHTSGAKMKIPKAEYAPKDNPFDLPPPTSELFTSKMKTKPGPILSRREYLCDASFLVALQGSEELVEILWKALQEPHWQLFLGRKSCSPSIPITAHEPGSFPDVISALSSIDYVSQSHSRDDQQSIDVWLEWIAPHDEDFAPKDAVIVYDVPISFNPHSYKPRYIVKDSLSRENISVDTQKSNFWRWTPRRPRANYQNTQFKKIRALRLIHDNKLCVLCKSPATTVQHVSYEHAGGKEQIEELSSLCRLCHDAATMLEYGAGMGMQRINPSDPVWRERLLKKRAEIVKYRSRTRWTSRMNRSRGEE
jgi:CRISPR system Cascade subunit CasD